VRVDDYMISASEVFYFVLKWFMISCVYSCTWRELSFMTVTVRTDLTVFITHTTFSANKLAKMYHRIRSFFLSVSNRSTRAWQAIVWMEFM
jgi:hypothetical protein